MKKILGLDIGTNSIGAALVNMPDTIDNFGKEGSIEWIGSRIIPTDGDYLQKFESGGQVETKAAARRLKRGSRRLKQRYKIRRERLLKVFKILGWVGDDFPKNFKKEISDDFKFNISNYLPFQPSSIDEAKILLGVTNKKGKLAFSEDWVIYYLRKKALTNKVSIAELARIIYMFNQRRGFKSGRKDLKNVVEESIERKWVEELTIISVTQKNEEKTKDGKFTYIITPNNPAIEAWEEKRFKKPDWENKKFTFLITVKNGKQLKPQIPSENDWELSLVALNNQMGDTHPGAYFFDNLVIEKNYKIRQRFVKRAKYEAELKAIWNKQAEFHSELSDTSKLHEIAEVLYPSQTKADKPKLKEILTKGLYHVIANDIIYYQRELKSQKKSVSGCRYEKIKYKNPTSGEAITEGVKVAPRSCPEFQEFRIWQDIHNIRIFEKDKTANDKSQYDVEITNDYVDFIAKEKLFQLFDTSKEVTEKAIFKTLNDYKQTKALTDKTHRISLFRKDYEEKDGKALKGNETKHYFRRIFENEKCNYKSEGELLLNNDTIFYQLWHILYSITSSDERKSEQGIRTALNKFNLPLAVVDELVKLPETPKQYGSYSSKAIRKLLPVMRCGAYWNWENIQPQTKERIEKIINEGWEKVDKETGEITFDKSIYSTKEQLQGLPTWMAGYVVYDRHSERENSEKYTAEEAKNFDILKLVPNNSLRNPLVEQVVRETLHLVKEICKKYGQPDEIHIELGRELKKNAKEREAASKANDSNLQEKIRIKKLLYELLNEGKEFEEYDENEQKVKSTFDTRPNPESPLDIEKFRVWKNCAGLLDDEVDKYFKSKDTKEKIPTGAEIRKYALWLTQKCRSPYTGKIIPLSKLFDETLYQKEHIIPQSKLKYDANENLVICEAAINPPPYKGSMLGMLFIQRYGGQTLAEKHTILTEEEYINHCKATFRGKKLKNLLAEEIPQDFISRQLNDTRHITRKISELLYPVAKEKEGIVFTGGGITSELKNKWGLNGVWKDLMRPRFERLEDILEMQGQLIKPNEKDANKYDFHVPEQSGFELKRIDHRHHALDALVIATTTREHIRYLNSLSSVDTLEEFKIARQRLVKGKIRDFMLPWTNFTKDAKNKLSETIISFKVNNKVTSKPKNTYLKWEEKEDGTWRKVKEDQRKRMKEKGKDTSKWLAVRKSMFKEPQGVILLKNTKSVPVLAAIEIQINRMKVQNKPEMSHASYVYDKEARQMIKDLISQTGISIENTDDLLSAIKKHLVKSKLKDLLGKEYEKINIAVFNEYAAKRVPLDKTFTIDKINKSLPYSEKSPIGNLLREHLKEKGNPEDAFQAEGLEELNKKAIAHPKIGKPIKFLTRYEKKDAESKFKDKYVEIDAGSNAYFIIYENLSTGERKEMYSLAAHKAIERKVAGNSIADEKEGYRKIELSPNELVYAPTEDEVKNPKLIDWSNKRKIFERTYKMVSCTGGKCEFVPHNIARDIIDDIELGSGNKNQRAWDGKVSLVKKETKDKATREDTGTMIKDVCIKLRIDRLGNIIEPRRNS